MVAGDNISAHAALMFDDDVAVAWCEYGTPEELPNIYHRKDYQANLDSLPDYRLTGRGRLSALCVGPLLIANTAWSLVVFFG